MIFLLSEVQKIHKVAFTTLAIGKDSQVTRSNVALEKVTEQHILTKCSKCITFQVKSDLPLIHEF